MELLSMGAFARVQRRMLSAGGVRVPMRRMVALTYIALGWLIWAIARTNGAHRRGPDHGLRPDPVDRGHLRGRHTRRHTPRPQATHGVLKEAAGNLEVVA
jgi:hypothetical protein